jgi:hypothetical protein
MRHWILGTCLAVLLAANSGCATIGTTLVIENSTKDPATRTLLEVCAYPVTVPVDIALLPVEAPVTAIMLARGLPDLSRVH